MNWEPLAKCNELGASWKFDTFGTLRNVLPGATSIIHSGQLETLANLLLEVPHDMQN